MRICEATCVPKPHPCDAMCLSRTLTATPGTVRSVCCVLLRPAHADVVAVDHAVLRCAVKKKIADDVIQKDEQLKKKKFPLVKKQQQSPVAVTPPVSAVSGTAASG